jgi:hypothetical protein
MISSQGMHIQRHPQGGFVCTCKGCGQAARVNHPQQFANAHNCARMGMGDVIAAGTKRLGIKPCKPCEQRRQKLNGLFPNFWRK